MKKIIAIICATVFACACATMVAGCGGGGGANSFAGTWVLNTMETGGMTYDANTISSIMGVEAKDVMTLELNADGSADMTAFGESMSESTGGVMNWSESANGVTLSSPDSDVSMELTYNAGDGTLAMDYEGTAVTFKKA